MSAGQNSRIGLLYFISALVALSSLAVIASLFMPWVVVYQGFFGDGSSGPSAFWLARHRAADGDFIIFLVVSALVIVCLGVIVTIMVGVTRGGWDPRIKGFVLSLSSLVLLAGFLSFWLALKLSAEDSWEFEFGPGLFVLGLASLLTFGSSLWGVIALRRPA